MKKQFQILFAFLSLFLLNGNANLYANTYLHSDFSLIDNVEWTNNGFESIVSSLGKNKLDKHSVEKTSFSNQTNFHALVSLSKPYPIKNKHKELELSNFVKKEEKIKPIYFKYIGIHSFITSFDQITLFSDSYFIKNLSLVTYFKSFLSYTYKRYLLLQVFRI